MGEELKEAKERFEALSKGRYYPKRLTLQEAKERLARTDPGLDISPLLSAKDAAELKRAALSLLAQSAQPQTLSYFSPLLVEALDEVLKLLDDR